MTKIAGGVHDTLR